MIYDEFVLNINLFILENYEKARIYKKSLIGILTE